MIPASRTTVKPARVTTCSPDFMPIIGWLSVHL